METYFALDLKRFIALRNFEMPIWYIMRAFMSFIYHVSSEGLFRENSILVCHYVYLEDFP